MIASPAPNLILAMDAAEISEAIQRIADEIVEHHPRDFGQWVIAGIPTRGVEVARRIVEAIRKSHSAAPDLGVVDISMHRDDLATRLRMTALESTQLPIDFDGRPLLLVDDVLFTGRSCRAAFDAINSFGRPSRIELAALVDRGHRELPIQPDYVGKVVATKFDEKIRVRFDNLDGEPDSVRVVKS